MTSISKRWPVFFLAVCALLPLWRAFAGGQTIGSFDVVQHMSPWNGPEAARPVDLFQLDGVLQFYNWRDLVLQSWGKGQLPAWNPYELGGTPLLASSQSGALYPPHILLGILRTPTGRAILVLAWLHLFWAGLGVYWLTRRLGAGRVGAAVAGAAFTLSPFMLSWTALPSVITTVSWIPWILACAITLFEEREVKVLAMHVAGLAACTAMMLLGGHLQFCAYGLMACGFVSIWLLCESLVRGDRKLALKSVLLVVFGIVLGAMLAAPQVLPVLTYAKFSHRANVA